MDLLAQTNTEGPEPLEFNVDVSMPKPWDVDNRKATHWKTDTRSYPHCHGCHVK